MKQKHRRLSLKSITQTKVASDKDADKTDLELLFQQAVDAVRKQILRRRASAQSLSRKPSQAFSNAALNQNEFETSLIKLADLGKGRVQLHEFSSVDFYNMLDLFVNNERVLQSMHSALFDKAWNDASRASLHRRANSVSQSVQLPSFQTVH